MKRLFDMVASGCGLLALSPLFLVVAIWIKFRNENELMEKAEDPEDYYIHVIMQEKIRLYLEYVENASFLYDLKLIFKTCKVIISG